MNAEKQRAVAPTTAQENSLQNESYPKAELLSRGKLKIGTLLLTLQIPLSKNQRKNLQQALESNLRKFIDLKYSGVQL